MYFRTLLSGTLAALLLSAAAADARSAGQANDPDILRSPAIGLPGDFDTTVADQTYQVAQASDPRVVALEEQIRSLNGTVEELNFQLLQLQEQIRKMQEDNEFRFQELEKRGDAATSKSDRAVAAAPQQTKPAQGKAPGSVEDVISSDTTNATDPAGNALPTLGTVTFDANGNPSGDARTDKPAQQGNETVAALPQSDDPEEIYRNSYQFILSGDYSTAEAGFRSHIERFPQSERTADAHFWLGEALLGQQKYRDAAETFLSASKTYPTAKKAPDMLLKLGVSLAGLNQREVACATFGEVGKRYPGASAALKERVKQEQVRAAC